MKLLGMAIDNKFNFYMSFVEILINTFVYINCLYKRCSFKFSFLDVLNLMSIKNFITSEGT